MAEPSFVHGGERQQRAIRGGSGVSRRAGDIGHAPDRAVGKAERMDVHVVRRLIPIGTLGAGQQQLRSVRRENQARRQMVHHAAMPWPLRQLPGRGRAVHRDDEGVEDGIRQLAHRVVPVEQPVAVAGAFGPRGPLGRIGKAQPGWQIGIDALLEGQSGAIRRPGQLPQGCGSVVQGLPARPVFHHHQAAPVLAAEEGQAAIP